MASKRENLVGDGASLWIQSGSTRAGRLEDRVAESRKAVGRDGVEARPHVVAGPSVSPAIAALAEEFAQSIARHVVDLLRAADLPDYYDQSTSPIGRRRFIGLVRRGVLPGAQVGRRFLVRRADVERWMAEHGGERPRPEPAGAADDLARELGLIKRR
jgi:excisionase family DNA binding protein